MVWRYLMSSANYTVQVKRTFGVSATDRPVQGDYDGDGTIDLDVYRRALSPNDGVFIVFQSSTSTQSAPFDWGDVDDYPVGFYTSH